jgi:hypothetical protein
MKLLAFRVGELYGLADEQGKEVLPAQFAYANESVGGLVVASSVKRHLVVIDSSTLAMRECRGWDRAHFAFRYGLLGVRTRLDPESPVGYVDRNCDFVIAPRFAWASSFDRTGATVKINREDKVERRIDRDGVVMGEAFPQILRFHPEGLYCGACIRWENRGEVIIDGTGRRVSERAFCEVYQEHEGLIPVVFEWGSVGWVNVKGEDVHRLRADGIGYHFQSGLIPVEEENGQWGLMNVGGEWVVDPEFDVVTPVGQNRFAVGHRNDREEASVRLADGQGNLLSDQVFDSIAPFSEGVAQVWRTKGRDDELEFNYIGFDGKLLFPRWS